MQKLEAVNRLLTIIRERPVESLTQPLNEDARFALQLLDRTSRDVQSQGWAFNTDKNATLPLDTSGEIPLPATTLKVQVSLVHAGPGNVVPVQRGSRLYNPTTRDFKFTSPIKAIELVLELAWDDLPPIAQAYIAASSEIQMAHGSNTDQSALSVAVRSERMHLREMKRQYANDTDISLLDGPSTTRIRERTRWLP